MSIIYILIPFVDVFLFLFSPVNTVYVCGTGIKRTEENKRAESMEIIKQSWERLGTKY